MHQITSAATDFTDFTIYDTARFGKGVKAKRDLPSSQILLQVQGPIITYQDTLALGDKESFCLQVGDDRYIFPDYPFFVFNHSCEPNCGINQNLQLKTIRPVRAGEPLCWDYSTSMLERGWKLACSCGARNCRHLINDFDTLPLALQEYYMDLNIVLPYLAERWKKVQAEHSRDNNGEK